MLRPIEGEEKNLLMKVVKFPHRYRALEITGTMRCDPETALYAEIRRLDNLMATLTAQRRALLAAYRAELRKQSIPRAAPHSEEIQG